MKKQTWVGKYRIQLAKFPRQNGKNPSLLNVLTVQSITPLYGWASVPCLIISP